MIWTTESASTISMRSAYIFPVTSGISAAVGTDSGQNATSMEVKRLRPVLAVVGQLARQGVRPTGAQRPSWPASSCGPAGTTWASRRPSRPPAAPTSASSTWPASRRTASSCTSRTGGPIWPPPTSCRTGTGPTASGQLTPVHVFSSGDEAELFVNNKSAGRQKKAQYTYRFRWDNVTYEPGELRVVTYKKGRPLGHRGPPHRRRCRAPERDRRPRRHRRRRLRPVLRLRRRRRRRPVMWSRMPATP